MDLSPDPILSHLLKEISQQLSHLYPVSTVASDNSYIISHLGKKKWPFEPTFPASFSSISLLPFYFLKELSTHDNSTSPILSRTLSNHFTSWKQPLSRPPVTTVFARFSGYLSPQLMQPMQQHLTQLLPPAWQIFITWLSEHYFLGSPSLVIPFQYPLKLVPYSPVLGPLFYLRSLTSGQPHPSHGFKIIYILTVLKLMFPTKNFFMNFRLTISGAIYASDISNSRYLTEIPISTHFSQDCSFPFPPLVRLRKWQSILRGSNITPHGEKVGSWGMKKS